MELGSMIKQLRKEKGINQESLADVFGISVQAVSKWECDLSCPDIALLPALAGFFGVTIDYLLTGADGICNAAAEFPDDGVFRIVQYYGNRLIRKDALNPSHRLLLEFPDKQPEGAGLRVEIWGNADIEGDVNGSVEAGAHLSCGRVNGSASAGAHIECGDVNGSANAGAHIECGNILGSAEAGGGINCGNVGGDVRTGGNVACGKVSGSVFCDSIG